MAPGPDRMTGEATSLVLSPDRTAYFSKTGRIMCRHAGRAGGRIGGRADRRAGPGAAGPARLAWGGTGRRGADPGVAGRVKCVEAVKSVIPEITPSEAQPGHATRS
ncbi:hypothetical protein GCM10022206_21420 [Streptomyces chiangmaiensis]